MCAATYTVCVWSAVHNRHNLGLGPTLPSVLKRLLRMFACSHGPQTWWGWGVGGWNLLPALQSILDGLCSLGQTEGLIHTQWHNLGNKVTALKIVVSDVACYKDKPFLLVEWLLQCWGISSLQNDAITIRKGDWITATWALQTQTVAH